MSVDIKTPTRTQYEHIEFPCGEKHSPLALQNVMAQPKVKPDTMDKQKITTEMDLPKGFSERRNSMSSQRNPRKRKLSERGGERAPNLNNNREGPAPKKGFVKPGRHGKSAERHKKTLPRKFLLGGSITDPLNLNSLYDDEVGKTLNESTPQSSPLPLPDYKQQVKVLIPANINDPLNLNAGGEEVDMDLISPKCPGKKKKHKHKKRKSTTDAEVGARDTSYDDTQPSETEQAKNVEIIPDRRAEMESKLEQIIQNITSPDSAACRKPTSKRMSSESGGEASTSNRVSICSDSGKPEKTAHHKPSRQSSHTSSGKPEKNNASRFVHGNYNRYYGYRNQETDDPRLKFFHKEWFEAKDVLDIGCNVGHVTLAVARDFKPRKIMGVDIDGKLIAVARKNIRHYLSNQVADTSKFPASLSITYGPIAVPQVPSSAEKSTFPHNVMFMQSNYVLEKDEELDMQCEEYDVIMALSITKWIHLNTGDAGLKRTFQRMFRQLRPGGKLILEPQSWTSYKRKKKLTDTISKNFQQIKLKPDRFRSYLLSRQVGFSTCEVVQMTHNKAKGFQRPIQIYTKPETVASTSPYDDLEWKGVTPLMEIDCTPSATPASHATGCTTPLKDICCSRGATPKFEIGSSGRTPCSTCPNTPSYMYNTWSDGGTPRQEHEAFSSLARDDGYGIGRRVYSTGFIKETVEFVVNSRGNTPEVGEDSSLGQEVDSKGLRLESPGYIRETQDSQDGTSVESVEGVVPFMDHSESKDNTLKSNTDSPDVIVNSPGSGDGPVGSQTPDSHSGSTPKQFGDNSQPKTQEVNEKMEES